MNKTNISHSYGIIDYPAPFSLIYILEFYLVTKTVFVALLNFNFQDTRREDYLNYYFGNILRLLDTSKGSSVSLPLPLSHISISRYRIIDLKNISLSNKENLGSYLSSGKPISNYSHGSGYSREFHDYYH